MAAGGSWPPSTRQAESTNAPGDITTNLPRIVQRVLTKIGRLSGRQKKNTKLDFLLPTFLTSLILHYWTRPDLQRLRGEDGKATQKRPNLRRLASKILELSLQERAGHSRSLLFPVRRIYVPLRPWVYVLVLISTKRSGNSTVVCLGRYATRPDQMVSPRTRQTPKRD